MRLTSSDETDLLLALHAGLHEESGWKEFLFRLRRRTGADHISLIFAQGDTPIHQSREIFSGQDIRGEASKLGLDLLYDKDRVPYDRLRPGRIYNIAEFASIDPDVHEFQQQFNLRFGLKEGLVVRIKEQEGTSAWLMLGSRDASFSASTGALLTALLPHVTVALRSFVLMERYRIRAAASSEGLDRANVGWIALARDARVVDIDPKMAALFEDMTGQGGVVGARLNVGPQARETLLQTAAAFAADVTAAPRAMILIDEPFLDALLVPIAARAEAALAVPVMLAFCMLAPTGVQLSCLLYSHLFGLSRREAELALLMSDGHSLREAAVAMGLTWETARSYSKRIYARLGVRGQAEMVRRIYSSSASLA